MSSRVQPLLVLCLLGSAVSAQSGPGLPKRAFEQPDMFRIIATLGSGNHGHSFMHDGWLAVMKSGAGVDFYDLSNPYAPRLVTSHTRSQFPRGMDLSEPHTVAQTTAWGGQHVVLMRGPGGLGGTGFAIFDWTDVFAPVREVAFDLPGVPGGYASGTFWLFVQAPYVYCPVGSSGLIVVDASDPQAPVVVNQIPKSRLGGFNTVVALAVGNLLVLTNSDSGDGFSLLDISDPVNPVLVNSEPDTVIPYAAQLNGGNLIVPAVSGCASCPGGNNGSFHVHALAESGFPIVNEIGLPSRGGSAVVQEEFAHVAASRAYVKIDIGDAGGYSVVGSTAMPYSGGDFDWVTPLGNMVALGDDQGFGTQIVPHQAQPDDTGPSVTMVHPRDGATRQALTSRIGITTSDMIELSSIDTTSFVVRPLGGGALSGSYSNQFGIVNFTPDEPLQRDTTYEVVVPAGGLRDWSGNGAPATFRSRFSTGATVSNIAVTARRNPPAGIGATVDFDVASVTGSGPIEYSWDFGDGTPPTPFSRSGQATHTYADAGHFSAMVTARNASGRATDAFVQTVHHPLTATAPARASTIVLDEASSRAWCVNVDNDTVTAVDLDTRSKVLETPVGARPRTLAKAPDGTIWVVCQGDATIRVLDPALGVQLDRIALPPASRPYGLVMRPDGGAAYVTLTAVESVARVDPLARRVVQVAYVGPDPRGIAVTADSRRVFVSRFVSSSRGSDGQPPSGEVRELSAVTLSPVRTVLLAFDPGPDTEASGRGVPNYLSSLTVSPDGRRLWVPSKKDNVARGLFRDGQPLTFESTVRTIVSQIDLATGDELLDERIDFNDRDMAFAVAFSPLGDYAFCVLQGSNAVDVRDAYDGSLVATVESTGLAPQGLAMTSDGSELLVHNFMSRTVSVYDVSEVTSSGTFAVASLGSVSTVASESLSPEVLLGKQIFYNAADPRMNEDGYISCASCHLEGGHDGRTWDFTDRGEGLRNTVSLLGRSGTGHGNVHWTANFDEIQDFENDIRTAFGGEGFMDDASFNQGTVSQPLGQPKAGLSPELDALAAYVSSLGEVGRSPFRDPAGGLGPAARRGRVVFGELGCARCHAGSAFTDSATGAKHDVGTLRPGSGHASGGPLRGLDTPTLRGLWATAPYLHDGSAATLMDVLTVRNRRGMHGATGSLTGQQLRDLVAFLRSIDDHVAGPEN